MSLIFKPEMIIRASLAISIIYGSITNYLISLRLNLNSDTVYLIWLSNEFWNRKNYLLDDCYLSSASNHLFTEWVPFILLPQVITKFDPSTIRLMSFIIFCLVIIVFSYLIFIISNNITNSLIFAALMSNLNFYASSFYLAPVGHIGALFFTGILIVIFSRLLIKEDGWYNLYFLIILLLAGLLVFSDSLILVWFLAPASIYYLVFVKSKSYKNNLLICLMNISSLIAYILKVYILPLYDLPVTISDKIYFNNIPIYLDRLSMLLIGSTKLNLFTFLIILIFLYLLPLSARQYLYSGNTKSKSIVYMLALSFFITSACYICLSVSTYDSATARYLVFACLSINFLISSYSPKITPYILLIFIIISSGAISKYTYIDSIEPSRGNQNELDLIEFLYHNNLTRGYGDYWDSNIITYLSNEKVIIRPASIIDGRLVPFRMLSCECWFHENSSYNFYIYNKDKPMSSVENNISSLTKNAHLERIMSVNNYYIFVFNQTPLSMY